MLQLKLQYFGHLTWRTDSLEKTVMLGKIEGDDKGWDGWMASPTQRTWVWASSRSCWWTGKPGVVQSMGSQRVGHNWATQLNWTELEKFSELSLKTVVQLRCGHNVMKTSKLLHTERCQFSLIKKWKADKGSALCSLRECRTVETLSSSLGNLSGQMVLFLNAK